MKAMKKTMSPEQVAANRANARKSTGPRTAAGKAVSRSNALKYGLLSREVVIRHGRLRESAAEFGTFRTEFDETLRPVGALETLLVERIVTIAWRLRRALRAETGEVTLTLERAATDDSSRYKSPPLSAYFLDRSDKQVACLKETTGGIGVLRESLRRLDEVVAQEGELTEAAIEEFLKHFGGKPNAYGDKLKEIRQLYLANAEGLEPEVLRHRQQEQVRTYLSRQVASLGWDSARLVPHEEAKQAGEEAAAALPRADVLDKILRYETTLDRQLHRAMNQLERLQRRRLGERVAAPVMVEVSGRN